MMPRYASTSIVTLQQGDWEAELDSGCKPVNVLCAERLEKGGMRAHDSPNDATCMLQMLRKLASMPATTRVHMFAHVGVSVYPTCAASSCANYSHAH